MLNANDLQKRRQKSGKRRTYWMANIFILWLKCSKNAYVWLRMSLVHGALGRWGKVEELTKVLARYGYRGKVMDNPDEKHQCYLVEVF